MNEIGLVFFLLVRIVFGEIEGKIGNFNSVNFGMRVNIRCLWVYVFSLDCVYVWVG